MFNPKNQKAITEIYQRLKKAFIVIILLMITSCGTQAPTPPTQQPPTPPTEAPQTDLIFEGELSDLQYQAAQNLALETPDQTEVYARQGVINSVIPGSSLLPGQAPEQQTQTYFTENADLYQISQFNQNFQQINQFDQANGAQIQQYQQTIQNIPVYRSDIRVALDSNGSIALVNSNYLPDNLLPSSLNPQMSSAAARTAFEALSFFLAEGAQTTLVIYSPVMVGQDGPSFLAWFAEAGWQGDYGEVLIKDSDGSLVSTSTFISTFTYEIRDFQKEVFDSEDPATYPTKTKIRSKPLLTSSSPGNYPEANKVDHLIDYISKTLQYYETNFNYSEFNTMDSEVKILVNLIRSGNESPFSLRKGSPFSLQDDEYAIPPLVAFTDRKSEQGIDIFAHEFQHLVTNDFVTLEHNFHNPQSSALSEALSDFFAAVADPSDQRWQVLLRGEPIRDMQDPINGVRYQSQPDHMDNYVTPKPNVKGEDSYGNGHINSTIFSHALYLLSEGGEKSGIKVFGIGIDTTAQIVFNSLPLLNNNAKFREARNAMLITCRNFTASGKLSKNHCNQVQNAFAAVGIGESARESSAPAKNLQGLQLGWALSPNLQLSNTFNVYEDLSHIGFNFVRELIPWDQIQLQPDGAINLAFGAHSKDLWANYIKSNNLKVMATLITIPWDANISDEEFLRLWRNYLYQLVPELTETVDYWEIGTQPNTPQSWQAVRPNAAGVDPALYAEILKIAYEVIKLSEKNDVVIFAGLNPLAGTKYPGLDPLIFIKKTLSACQSQCFDALGLVMEWGDYLPDQNRDLLWNGSLINVDMPSYIDLAVCDIKTIAGESTPIWITDIIWDSEWPDRLAETKQIELFEAQSEVIVKTIVSLASNESVQVIFYQDILDYDGTRVVGQDIYSLVYLLSGSQPLGSFPVYAVNNAMLDQFSQYRFARANAPEAAFVWTDDPTMWGSPARVETLEDFSSNMQKFTDFPNAGEVEDISFDSEFNLQKGIILLLAEMNSQDKLIVGAPAAIEYKQIKIWNWGNPEFYLTYDPAYWEATEYDFLVSKTYPDCHIAANGYRDGGPDGPPPYTYQSDAQVVGGIEYFLDIEIPNATGIPDMFHVYWNKQDEIYQYAVALFPGPEYYDECVTAFWEVMQLSEANNFGINAQTSDKSQSETIDMGQGFTLTYDPEKWSEGDQYLSSNLHPDCNILYGFLVDDYGPYQVEQKTIGITQFEISTGTESTSGEVKLRIYNFEIYDRYREILIWGFTDPPNLTQACLADAEEVITISESKGFLP